MAQPKVNRIGRKSGRLTVIANIIPSEGEKNQGGLWRCRCDCGNIRDARGYYLASSKTISCGCATVEGNQRAAQTRRNNKEGGYLVTLRFQYRLHRNIGARQRGYIPLSWEDWKKIALRPCSYCGGIDTRNVAAGKVHKAQVSIPLTEEQISKYEAKVNGIDRVDSNLGYELSNCVPCCAMCNRMKMDHPLDKFLAKVEQVYHYTKGHFSVANLAADDPDISK